MIGILDAATNKFVWLPTPIIFQLNMSPVRPAKMQPALLTTALIQPAIYQQRMKAVQGRPALTMPINLPWNSASSRQRITPDRITNFPNAVHQLMPYPPTYFRLTGITKDSTGAVLGGVTVQWFNTADDKLFYETTSDANGVYEFRTAGQPPNAYYLVAYKPGSPDVAGTTVNTLVGV